MSMRDSSGNGCHGLYTGVTLNAGLGAGGQRAVYFDGLNDYATMPASIDNVFPANEGTVCLWAKLDDPDDFDYFFAYRDGSFEFYVHRTAITRIDSNGVKTISVSTNDANDTREYHIAVTWSVSNNRMRRYKNGVLTHAIANLASYTVTPPATLRIVGAASETPTHVMRGWMHDVVLFSRELTPAEITKLL